ncbi:MAG: hypothetical protein HYZ53_25045 [Planctomycetes bacterium]|nr:hypothetical protein [Planctomycetota bacterium]
MSPLACFQCGSPLDCQFLRDEHGLPNPLTRLPQLTVFGLRLRVCGSQDCVARVWVRRKHAQPKEGPEFWHGPVEDVVRTLCFSLRQQEPLESLITLSAFIYNWGWPLRARRLRGPNWQIGLADEIEAWWAALPIDRKYCDIVGLMTLFISGLESNGYRAEGLTWGNRDTLDSYFRAFASHHWAIRRCASYLLLHAFDRGLRAELGELLTKEHRRTPDDPPDQNELPNWLAANRCELQWSTVGLGHWHLPKVEAAADAMGHVGDVKATLLSSRAGNDVLWRNPIAFMDSLFRSECREGGSSYRSRLSLQHLRDPLSGWAEIERHVTGIRRVNIRGKREFALHWGSVCELCRRHGWREEPSPSEV